VRPSPACRNRFFTLALCSPPAQGIFGALVILLAAVAFAAGVAVAARRRGPSPSPAADADALVLLALLWTSLGMVVIIFKVVGIYHMQFNTNPNLYFPLQVLPQLLALCIVSYPRLMARMGMGARYEEWQAGGPAKAEAHTAAAAAAPNGKHEQQEQQV
jgi:hypothetical protein